MGYLLSLLLRESFWQIRIYLRDGMAVLFTFLLPGGFLVFWGRQEGADPFGASALAATLAAAVSGYATLAIGIASAREAGVLKRIRSTPFPLGWHLAGRLLAHALLGTLALGLVLGVGAVVLGFPLKGVGLAGILGTVWLGIAALGSLGLWVGSLASSAARAAHLTNATLFPLFVLTVFAQQGRLPEWALPLVSALPLQSMAALLRSSLEGGGWSWGSAVILFAWMGIGLGLAGLRFARSPS
ncbi:ABC transporter permease [Thermus tengchongensis]|uniref:ABC-2 type transporter transmembrane domain-containing protein n=1 Tax=Thermus tengchongensis TaxID=1214928 RepID=A0A4Y9F9K1_9DEIN|nr:ABC transporter permease [Thermus tengchongensis]TFU25199.1 hypothetical protein E0687_12070 [Thermus tengchongensis]